MSEVARNLIDLPDQTFALRDGHYALVAGRIFGPWPDLGAATAGMQVEQRRATARVVRATRVALPDDYYSDANKIASGGWCDECRRVVFHTIHCSKYMKGTAS